MNTENNILIAEFMNIVFDDSACQYYDSEVGVYIGYLLRYDHKWDWLQEAVNKCSQKASDLDVDSMFKVDLWMFVTNDIEAVYNAVIEFINGITKINKKQGIVRLVPK